MQGMDVFVGIDVAFAKHKRLPICISKWENSRFIPLDPCRQTLSRVPRGRGNRACINEECRKCFATQTKDYLLDLVEEGFKIRRIAIDAPRAPKSHGERRRESERELERRDISYYPTPSSTEFEEILLKVNRHIGAGQPDSNFPHANQLWMLVGFDLFRELSEKWECIEVFPHAIMWCLGACSIPKSRAEGVTNRLRALRRYTGWPTVTDSESLRSLSRMVGSPAHDAVDAYASAWIAALEPPYRIPLGNPQEDAIWIPSDELLQGPTFF
jgi:hypothetical protein